MPNPRKPIPSRHLSIAIDEADAARMDMHLYSEAEQRIPYAARQRFIQERLREFFSRRSLDLAVYMPELPPGSLVYGPAELVTTLQLKLEGEFLVQS